MTDSAGQPWEGRRFHPNPAANDDGSADPGLLEALRRARAGELGEADVVDAVRSARLLVPLVAELGEGGRDEHGGDKSQELSIVTVSAPDGRAVLPAFTSVDTMRAWDPSARPIPTPGERVALAAAGEGTELVILDPTSPTEFGIRRPALWAIAKREPWRPSYLDEEVLAAFLHSAVDEAAVHAVQLAPGDPGSRLTGPELLVHLTLEPGLDRASLDALMGRLQARWADDAVITERVDSIAVRLAAVS